MLPILTFWRRRANGAAFDFCAIAALTCAIRLPFLSRFDLVSYDGTFYIRQAERMRGGGVGGGSFPPGYPAMIAGVLFTGIDPVRAAQIVSFVGGLVACALLYALVRRDSGRLPAVLAACVLTTTPLFVRSTMDTMSEAVYVAWILASMLAFARHRHWVAGVLVAAAAITRPEALAIAAAMAIVSAGNRRRVAAFAAGVVPLYLLGAAYVSIASGHFTLLPKADLFGSASASYAARLPADMFLFARHALPAALLLALAGLRRRRDIVAGALFVPLFVNPLFTPRTDARFVVAFIAPALWLAFATAGSIAVRWRRGTALVALCACAIAGIAINRDQLTRPISPEAGPDREAGLRLRPTVAAGSRLADRKPFVAFYAGAAFVEVPLAPYEVTVSQLASTDVDYLSLSRGTTDFFRPALTPLLYDAALINGELRYGQALVTRDVIVYERVPGAPAGPLSRILAELGAAPLSLSWAGDGTRLALAMPRFSGGVIVSLDASSGEIDTLFSAETRLSGAAWSPDARTIVFVSTERGNAGLYLLQVKSGMVSPLVVDEFEQREPAWGGDDSVVFVSDRDGTYGIWRVDVRDKVPMRITGGGARHPSISSSGTLSWILSERGVVITARDGLGGIVAPHPLRPVGAASWSGDGTTMVVAGEDRDHEDLYLVRADGRVAVNLLHDDTRTRFPSWRPGAEEIACVRELAGRHNVVLITGFEPWRLRLASPPTIAVLTPFGNPESGRR